MTNLPGRPLKGLSLEQAPELALQDLAVGVARQRLGEEGDAHRSLEGGEAGADPVLQFLLARRPAGRGLNDRRRLLAERAVGKADQSRVADRGMVEQDVLDLDRIDVLTAA